VRADAGRAKGEVCDEEIDYPVAVRADCGAYTGTVLSVGSCLGDLFGRPRIPTVAGETETMTGWGCAFPRERLRMAV